MAAFSEWVLALRVQILSRSGETYYEKSHPGQSNAPQVIIYSNGENESFAGDELVDRSYIVPSGARLVGRARGEENVFCGGRAEWATILRATSGPSAIEKLLGGGNAHLWTFSHQLCQKKIKRHEIDLVHIL